MAVPHNMHLEALHKQSSHHRNDLFTARICSCFYCLQEFPPDQITEWIDRNDAALCPFCGIASVLPFSDEIAGAAMLNQMHAYWFERTVKL